MNKNLKDFIQNVQELMEERDWSQRKLSEISGITQSAISTYLSGKVAPQLETLHELSRAFGVSVNRLLVGPQDEVVVKREKIKPTVEECLEILRTELSFYREIPTEMLEALREIHNADAWDQAIAALKRVQSRL